MRLTVSLACFFLVSPVAVAQETRDPDGSDLILKELAKGFKDDRTVEQIKKDNALIRAAAK